MELLPGFEPGTSTLPRWCSTYWAITASAKYWVVFDDFWVLFGVPTKSYQCSPLPGWALAKKVKKISTQSRVLILWSWWRESDPWQSACTLAGLTRLEPLAKSGKGKSTRNGCFDVELMTGIGPVTSALPRRCSTDWATSAYLILLGLQRNHYITSRGDLSTYNLVKFTAKFWFSILVSNEGVVGLALVL